MKSCIVLSTPKVNLYLIAGWLLLLQGNTSSPVPKTDPKTDPKTAPDKQKTPKSKKKKGGLFASFGRKKKKEKPPPQPACGNINPTLDPELAEKFKKRRGEETAVRYIMVLGVVPLFCYLCCSCRSFLVVVVPYFLVGN
jgi:hypothetical protein